MPENRRSEDSSERRERNDCPQWSVRGVFGDNSEGDNRFAMKRHRFLEANSASQWHYMRVREGSEGTVWSELSDWTHTKTSSKSGCSLRSADLRRAEQQRREWGGEEHWGNREALNVGHKPCLIRLWRVSPVFYGFERFETICNEIKFKRKSSLNWRHDLDRYLYWILVSYLLK